MRLFVSLFLLILALSGGGYFYVHNYWGQSANSFRTAVVKRDNMMPTISATGTAEPEETIDVGAEVAGLIKSLGTDPKNPAKSIDYGSEVAPDTVLALIDDSIYKAQLASARAALAKSTATLVQLKALLAKANADLKRGKELMAKNAMAQGDYDTAVAAQAVAAANVDVGVAAIEQDRASLSLAETNLGYTVIKSPVNGVIIDRRVNVGQTVVSALNAPSLFLLAKDMRRMQVWASVNEADIGKIHTGQPVHFTVDAYPNDKFEGAVDQIRLNATMTQNVVTYTVVVETNNSDLKLLPYMTTNLQFELERHNDVLVVPNAALRWKPKKTQIAAEFAEAAARPVGKHGSKDGSDDASAHARKDDAAAISSVPNDSASSSIKSGSSSTASSATASDNSASNGAATTKDSATGADDRLKAAIREHRHAEAMSKDSAQAANSAKKGKKVASSGKPHEHSEWGRIWVKDGNFVQPVDVKIIATDGSMTEIAGKAVQEGMEVVIGENIAVDDSGETTNPFAPKLFGGKK